MSNDPGQEVSAALVEIQRYLLDEIPPLTATEAVQTLMGFPPDLLIKQINAWALEQGRIQGAGMADCLFHALKKVHMISTLKLIEQGPLEGYLNTVLPYALRLCPPEDREELKKNLASLRQSLNFSSPIAVDIERFGGGAAPQKPGILSEVASRTARRFSLVIDRLLRKGAAVPSAAATAAAAPTDEPSELPFAQLVSMAAESASSEEELNQFVETLKPITGHRETKDLIGILASGVPGWEIVAAPDSAVKPPKSIEAMHKVISLTRDPTKSATRFRELIMSAIEQFNSGSLGAAVSILDLAEIIVTEKKMDASTVDRMRADALAALSSEQLKKYSENKAKHPALRKVLSFFPTLKKETLFADLRGEQKPERRRAILGLLEAYGAEVRAVALCELEKELALPVEQADTYYLRNLIYLLHRVPRESDESLAKEFELLTRSSAIGQSIYVIKEAIIPLGQIKTDASVKLLTTRLAEFEAMLIRAKDAAAEYLLVEVQKLLDRIINALARIGTPAALLTIARHGMRANPILGDTRARLAALSQFDLSFDEQTVNVIVKAIREEMPSGKILSRLTKRQPPPIRLIEALAGTRSEMVESLFADIAENFPDEDVGRAAAAALKSSTADKPATGRDSATLTGDLQFFGLPALMQSLAEMQATGIVTLIDKQTGQTAAKMLFVQGQFADAMIRNLRGVDAFYQLLERPIVGSFAFVPNAAANTKAEPQAVVPLLFEGIRRHDELREACVVIPDDLALRPTAVKPTPSADEKDPAIIRDVWVKASGGGRVGEWESQIAADAYRVRRLVAHWVEQGALQAAG
ncbi:MAG TPA: DUF4388 domain-containing protein [Thermoanaerobaculia bacterium]